MSDYDDRGAYTPPSDRLAFDPRQPVRGGGPAPVTLIVSGLVLVGLVGGVFFLYRDGFRHRGEGPTLVGAPVADVRTDAAPTTVSPSPGALVVDKTAAAPPAPPFAPPAETPLPRAAPVATSNTSALPPPPPQGVPTHPAPPPQVVALAPESASETAPKPIAVHAAAVASETAPKSAARHPAVMAGEAAPPVLKAARRHAVPLTIASLTDEGMTRRAPARTAAPPAVARHPKPTMAVALAPMPRPKAAGAALSSATGPAAGWVQIGAFSSPDLADQGWREIASAEPDAMAGKGKAVEPLDREGKTLYRTYVTGFSTIGAAQAFCDDLRAAGKSCMVK